jgi:hypothetical protein
MAEVYGNAIVNIAATNATDGSMGLFVERDISKVERQYFQTRKGNIFEIMDGRISERCLVGTPLSSRAWAFQERYLAQRTLHFTAEQIFAECHQHIACESWPKGLPPEENIPYFQPTRFPERHGKSGWPLVVARYSEAQLTYSEDKMVALSGVARRFQERLNDQYVAGLWRNGLLSQLCWSVNGTKTNADQNISNIPYRAPTWSWAAIDQPITWRLYCTIDITSDEPHYEPLIEIIDVDLVSVGQDELGQLQDAKLQVRTNKVVKIAFLQSFLDCRESYNPPLEKDGSIPLGWRGMIKYDQDEPTEEQLDNIYLLPALEQQGYRRPGGISLCGLILAPEPFRGKGYFIRLGVFDIILFPFHTRREFMQYLSTQPNELLDDSGYEKILALDEDGDRQYMITLV